MKVRIIKERKGFGNEAVRVEFFENGKLEVMFWLTDFAIALGLERWEKVPASLNPAKNSGWITGDGLLRNANAKGQSLHKYLNTLKSDAMQVSFTETSEFNIEIP